MDVPLPGACGPCTRAAAIPPDTDPLLPRLRAVIQFHTGQTSAPVAPPLRAMRRTATSGLASGWRGLPFHRFQQFLRAALGAAETGSEPCAETFLNVGGIGGGVETRPQQGDDGLGVFPAFEQAEGFEGIGCAFLGRLQRPCEVVQMRAAAGALAERQRLKEVLPPERREAAAAGKPANRRNPPCFPRFRPCTRTTRPPSSSPPGTCTGSSRGRPFSQAPSSRR